MNPVPNEQDQYAKEIEEFLAKGGTITKCDAGARTENIQYTGGFYQRRKKKKEDEEAKK